MPAEYCSYGPDFETYCTPWLIKNHPDVYRNLFTKTATNDSAEGADEDGEARPSAPWTTEERLVAFYTKYMPEKLDNVPALLEKYEGTKSFFFKTFE